MNIDDIKKLLESFYEAKTSPEEELLLLNYFNSTDIADELIAEREVFLGFYESEALNIPSNLESKLTQLIDEQSKINSKPKQRTQLFLKWASIAACFALLVSSVFYFNNVSLQGDNQALIDNIDDMSKEQYIEMENALRLFSSNFDKGLKQLDDVRENLEKTNDILNDTFKKN